MQTVDKTYVVILNKPTVHEGLLGHGSDMDRRNADCGQHL